MDPLTTSILAGTITTLMNSAAGEAGKTAWKSLVTGTRHLLGDQAPATQALEAVDAAATTHVLNQTVEQAAQQLLDAAATTPDYDRLLQDWHSQARVTVQLHGETTNVVSGHAKVGTVIQAHEIGSVNLK